jgi:hypothetical protein
MQNNIALHQQEPNLSPNTTRQQISAVKDETPALFIQKKATTISLFSRRNDDDIPDNIPHAFDEQNDGANSSLPVTYTENSISTINYYKMGNSSGKTLLFLFQLCLHILVMLQHARNINNHTLP